jgi:hypothetical protein
MKEKLKDMGGKHEDLMLSRGAMTKIKLQQKQTESEQLKILGCTFRPTINRSSSLSSRMHSSRAKSARGSSNHGTARVFENLYKTARLSQEKV